MIGDESHYLFVCHSFANVRKRYLPNVLYDNIDVSLNWKKIFKLDTKQLVGVSRFINIILKHFDSKLSSKNKSNKNEFILKTTETRCGRKIKPPSRFDL